MSGILIRPGNHSYSRVGERAHLAEHLAVAGHNGAESEYSAWRVEAEAAIRPGDYNHVTTRFSARRQCDRSIRNGRTSFGIDDHAFDPVDVRSG